MHCQTTVVNNDLCLYNFMFTTTALRGVTPAESQQIYGRRSSLPCSRQPVSRLQHGQSQLSTPAQHTTVHSHRAALQPISRPMHLRSRQIVAQALNEEASQRQRSAGSGSEAVARGGTGSTTSRLGELLNSPFDADIFNVALPALASIMLDAIMLLVDTGAVMRGTCAQTSTSSQLLCCLSR